MCGMHNLLWSCPARGEELPVCGLTGFSDGEVVGVRMNTKGDEVDSSRGGVARSCKTAKVLSGRRLEFAAWPHDLALSYETCGAKSASVL